MTANNTNVREFNRYFDLPIDLFGKGSLSTTAVKDVYRMENNAENEVNFGTYGFFSFVFIKSTT